MIKIDPYEFWSNITADEDSDTPAEIQFLDPVELAEMNSSILAGILRAAYDAGDLAAVLVELREEGTEEVEIGAALAAAGLDLEDNA